MYKKPIFWLGGIALAICIVIAVSIWLRPSEEAELLKVMTISDSLEETQYQYWSVLESKNIKEIDEFKPGEAHFYYVDVLETFNSKIENNKIVNEYVKPVIADKDGNDVMVSDIMINMLQSAAQKIHHDIWSYTIIEIEGRYFAFIQLNAGWVDHGDLYEYRFDTKVLQHMAELDDVNVVGISFENI